tara:strand:- start:297242 stop:297892 length:651 start_codon:yes stop_codon:yes gene_type:complete
MAGRIVCLGDSITEGVGDERGIGWVGRIAERLSKQERDSGVETTRILNLGVAGDTSIDIKHRLCSEAFYRNPDILVIAAGVNDTAYRLWPERGGAKIDLHNSRFTWREIFMLLQGRDIPIIFIGPTPVDEATMPQIWRAFDEHDKGTDLSNTAISAYNDMLKAEATDAGYNFVDLYNTIDHAVFQGCLGDGLHPNSAGYDLMSDIIFDALEDMLPQ